MVNDYSGVVGDQGEEHRLAVVSDWQIDWGPSEGSMGELARYQASSPDEGIVVADIV